jgi:pimeloyl-ACP methyl ester carboxylesterase
VNRQLVFVHGRSQQNKDAVDLKREWIGAFQEGLGKSGLALPIAEEDIRFPYYGQTLFDLARGASPDDVARVVVRGAEADFEERRFVATMLEEVREAAGISEAELADAGGAEVQEYGPGQWGWVHTLLELLDRRVCGASGASIATFTHDVYHYLKKPGVQDAIEAGVRAAISPGIETVVVGHSLGTVVSYRLLRREGESLGWQVPLFVTLGSPLAITAIRRALAPIGFPRCARRWFNAMDEADIVALYPLDARGFDVDPAIENKTDVHNQTQNRHGIAGYLNDAEVARRIHAALTAPLPQNVAE